MRIIQIVLFIILIVALCTKMKPVNEKIVSEEVLNKIYDSEKAWNSGSLEDYMQVYEHSDSLRFAGNDTYTLGWQTALDRYRKSYPDKNSMGNLSFSELHVNVIGKDAALVFGRWTLDRETDHPTGLFTLLFRKTKEGWKIMHDHSSGNPTVKNADTANS